MVVFLPQEVLLLVHKYFDPDTRRVMEKAYGWNHITHPLDRQKRADLHVSLKFLHPEFKTYTELPFWNYQLRLFLPGCIKVYLILKTSSMDLVRLWNIWEDQYIDYYRRNDAIHCHWKETNNNNSDADS